VSSSGGGYHWAARGLLAATLSMLLSAEIRAAVPPKLSIDLDRFDARKKVIALPDGESLAYVSWGNPAGKPVVLIHGYTDSASDWAPLVPFLSKSDRLILVDIRGHGKSSKPECCYTRFDFAYDIKLLLDALHIKKADIIGHSLGSYITQTFAEFWPDRTNRVVLIASTAVPPQFDYSPIRNLKEPIDPDSPFMISFWSSPTPVDPEFLSRKRRQAAEIPLRVWIAVMDQRLGSIDLKSTLPRLTAPVLLIWGSEDFIMKAQSRDSLRAALPNAQVKIFDGLGHNPFWEDPAGVAAVINQFLDRPR
jgi:pimeloyl-ACP methyl ester carboxylesterase